MTGAEKMKGLAAIVTRVSPDPTKQLTVEQDERIALQALMFLLGEPQQEVNVVRRKAAGAL